MASRIARSALGASRIRPALPLRTLPSFSKSLPTTRQASNVPAEEPVKKAQSILDALPGNSLISKTAILSSTAGISIYAISNEWYVFNEESVVMAAMFMVYGALFKYAGPYIVEWAEKYNAKVMRLMVEAREGHKDTVRARMEDVKKLANVIDTTKQLFEVSRETARLEAQAFELEQRTKVVAEAKSVLDSWVRYEGQVKQRQQRELADTIIKKITRELENPRTLNQILIQSVSDVERLVGSKAQ